MVTVHLVHLVPGCRHNHKLHQIHVFHFVNLLFFIAVLEGPSKVFPNQGVSSILTRLPIKQVSIFISLFLSVGNISQISLPSPNCKVFLLPNNLCPFYTSSYFYSSTFQKEILHFLLHVLHFDSCSCFVDSD